MFSFEWVGAEQLVSRLQSMDSRLEQELSTCIGMLTLKLQLRVKQHKLSGQVLKKRTGTLARSIDRLVEKNNSGISGVVNTNLAYGRVHEYGFTGTVNVKAHLRQVKQLFGRNLSQPITVQVRPHSRQVKFPERSFLRSALRNMQPEIEQQIKQAITKATQ